VPFRQATDTVSMIFLSQTARTPTYLWMATILSLCYTLSFLICLNPAGFRSCFRFCFFHIWPCQSHQRDGWRDSSRIGDPPLKFLGSLVNKWPLSNQRSWSLTRRCPSLTPNASLNDHCKKSFEAGAQRNVQVGFLDIENGVPGIESLFNKGIEVLG
jgi:hypothetical protein